MNIKDMVRDNKSVSFIHYKNGDLWYRTECGFEFPVPASDARQGTFFAIDRAILFTRYIRKHIAYLNKVMAAGIALANSDSAQTKFVCLNQHQY